MTTREKRADQKLEQAAREADRGTRAGRETAARLLTQANAIKRGAPVPAFATTPRKP